MDINSWINLVKDSNGKHRVELETNDCGGRLTINLESKDCCFIDLSIKDMEDLIKGFNIIISLCNKQLENYGD